MAPTLIRPDVFTCKGNYFSLLDPDPNSVMIEEIAHALSHICRFNGHTRTFYSVAQHSVMVSRLVPHAMALAGLLHDAAEAYLGDITSPLKQFLPEYLIFEKRVEKAILAHFHIPYPLPPAIKSADLVALATETRDLMPEHADVWEVLHGIEPLPCQIKPLAPPEAKHEFLSRFKEIGIQ